MQIVQRPSLCIQQHCPERTRACAPSHLPPCTAPHVTSPVPIPPCRTILQEGRSRRRGASCCNSSATPLSDLTATDQALQLVQSLAEDLDSLKQKPLSSRCSLSIYRLTKLCNSSQDFKVALALTLDSKRHDGKGVFLHIVQLLQQDEDASSQNLAADLIQALFSSNCIDLEDSVPLAHSLTLPILHHSFDCNPLVEVITSSNKLKVKTSAVLVLLLIEAAGGHRKVLDSGAAVVTLLEMLSVANSWPASSTQQLPQQSSSLQLQEQPSAPVGLHTLSEVHPAHTVPQEIAACSTFMAACSTLLHRLMLWQLQEVFEEADLGSALRTSSVTINEVLSAIMAFAVSTCDWQSAQQSSSKLRLPRVLQWWRRRTYFYPAVWSFMRLGYTVFFNVSNNSSISTSRMLSLADRIRKQQQAARDMFEDSEAIGVEDIITSVTATVVRLENNRYVVSGPQVQSDALVRIMMPSLLALLQHPVEARRVFAAETANLLAAASNTVVSALLSSSHGLSTLLMRLSGDDTPEARSSYAELIARCVAHCDAAALKKISDSGAVPYLLKLLREAVSGRQQQCVVACLEALAKASTEIVTSIVVHGGTQQLLDLVHAGVHKGIDGRVQLHEETLVTTRASIATLRLMLYEPAAAADIIEADLAGLVLQIMQGPSLESSIATVINFLYHFSKQPTGRQQLLLKLTPDIARSMIDTCLKCLEAPQYDEPALIIATDLLGLVGETTVGRQQLAVPSVASRLSAVFNHTSTPDSPGYSQAQGYVLPALALLSYLKPDGTYHPNPWFVQPTPAPQAADRKPPQTSDQASSEADPQQGAASARLSQHSTAELAHATPAGTAGQQTHNLPGPLAEELQAHQQFQEHLVQNAAVLVSHSPFPDCRLQAMTWLRKLVPQLTDLGCVAVASSGAVAASFQAITRESEAVETRRAALWFCVSLHQRGTLPAAVLLEAGMQHHLTQLVVQSGNIDEMGEAARHLLSVLWQAKPQLVSEFVSQGHLPALLNRAAHMHGSTNQNCVMVLTLVHQVCTCTASLVSEPLLLQAIPDVVQCCQKTAGADHPRATAQVLQSQANLQEKAVSLLCSLAEFPFYRPAIRKADPASPLTSLLAAGCSPDHGVQQRTIAQLALNLVYKLLQGQLDESDGLDAPFNHSFLEGLILHRQAGMSVMRMYKQGTAESRPLALAVLKLFLIHKQRPVHLHTMQQGLISLGLMPLLFGIAQAPETSPKIKAMADACLASVHSEQNTCMAAFGTHGLIARLVARSLHEQHAGTHPDRRGR